MASGGTLLSEEQLLCSVCLDIFTEPVSIQCGHTFCKTCITEYWDTSAVCQCPLCKKTLHDRPDVFVNIVLLEMANQFRESSQKRATSAPDQQVAELGDVCCDFCTDKKNKALKSCLVCLASYCQTHLEPHERVAGLKKHKLIDPVGNLEDRVCKKHERPLELFCRTDQTCLCQFCTEVDHKSHYTVPVEDEYRAKKDKMRREVAEVQHMIKEREQKVIEIKQSIERSSKDAKQEIADSIEVFTALVAYIQRSQNDLIELIDERQKAAERQAEGFIKELEQEIADLKKRGSDLEQLSLTEDHIHFLQSFSSLSTPLPKKDWSDTSINSDLSDIMQNAMAQLEKTLSREMAKMCDELKRMQRYAVDVILDPDTAHPNLILSNDGKRVNHRVFKANLPDNPERFLSQFSVLGKQSFSSGRFYYEVQVKRKTAWTLGVAAESISRKMKILKVPENGYWVISLRKEKQFYANNIREFSLLLKKKLQKVGVFVDYDKGVVSFYNIEANVHIYSFTGCRFSEKLYPYFCPCGSKKGTNSAPLIICPMNNGADE